MSNWKLSIGLLAASLIALSGCESVSSEPNRLAEDDPRRGEAIDTVCFTGGLSGFYEVGDQAIVLRDGPNKSYLVETGFCPNINQPEGLRILGDSQCLQRGDRIEVFDTALPRQGSASDMPDRCIVSGLFDWTEIE